MAGSDAPLMTLSACFSASLSNLCCCSFHFTNGCELLRGVALKHKKTELGSLVSGQGVSWDLPLSQIIPSSMGSRCLDSPSSQPALSGGLVLPTLFAVHGVLTPPQSTV
ncbi:hypothetical protein YC2023_041364 [Brassica napus]